MVVVGVLVAFIALAVLKPWAAAAPSASSAGFAATSPALSQPQPTTSHGELAVAPRRGLAAAPEAGYMSPIALAWADMSRALSHEAATPSLVAVLPGAGQPVVHTSLRTKLPTTQALGPTCDSAPALPEGYENFGLTLPAPSPSVTVVRLFATGAPLAVSVDVSVDGSRRLAIVSMRNSSWPIGHYALVLESRGAPARYVPFCVSRDVPTWEDEAQARIELWDEAQP